MEHAFASNVLAFPMSQHCLLPSLFFSLEELWLEITLPTMVRARASHARQVTAGGVEVARAVRYAESLGRGGRNASRGNEPFHDPVLSLDGVAATWRNLSVEDLIHRYGHTRLATTRSTCRAPQNS